MPPPPETPRKRIHVLRDEQCLPTYVLKSPPCINWADSVFQLRDTILDSFNDFTKVDNSCCRIVTYNPELASELALQNKQTQTDSVEPVAPPPRRTYASAAVSHTPLQEQPHPPPTTPRAKPAAAKPTNPVRIVVQLKHFPTLPARDLPARDIYQQLVTSCATIPRAPTPLGVHWNRNNNLIIAFPAGTSRTTIKTLFPSIHSLVGTEDPPVICFDVPWRKVHLAGIHARNNTDQPITPVEELRQTLLLNPALLALKITIQPTWLKKPEAISGTHTSAIIAFEDPDGSVERTLLKSTLFAFGEAITVKKWHEKSPARK
ncbi:hypothetical protein RSOLAG22IIIB_06696 [Rhizoctonia solani]|uniref:Uncharacterized protein n=1 Tax=Rhizoctonia solani TaxID=456999 RepID=A0A0K6GH08_9AGAM|nr:hypothetical protein RSOLAG22IIIB_06696 [Rhizoctonia solani]